MLRWRWFRSPCVRCFSVNHVTGEHVKGAIAAPLTIPAPGKKIAASRIVRPIPGAHPFGASASAVQNCSRQFCLRLFPSGYRVGHQPASMQAMPSRRVHAPRPGLTETLRRFTAGPGHRCKLFACLIQNSSLQVNKFPGNPQPCWSKLKTQWCCTATMSSR